MRGGGGHPRQRSPRVGAGAAWMGGGGARATLTPGDPPIQPSFCDGILFLAIYFRHHPYLESMRSASI